LEAGTPGVTGLGHSRFPAFWPHGLQAFYHPIYSKIKARCKHGSGLLINAQVK
jgi:hypothetical protein